MQKLILYFVDIVLIIIGYILSLLIKSKGLIYFNEKHLFTVLSLLFLFLVLLYFYNFYNHLIYVQRLKLLFKVIKIWLIAIFIYVISGFLTKFAFLIGSRGFIFNFYGISFLLFVLVRLLLIPDILTRYFIYSKRRTVCRYIGTHDKFEVVRDFFYENLVAGFTFVNSTNPVNCKDNCKDTFLYSESNEFDELYQEIKTHLVPGQQLHIASKLFKELGIDWEFCYIEDVPVLTFLQKRNQGPRSSLIRFIDIICSMVALILMIPIFIILAIVIKLDSPGPVVYRQKRCGKNGKEFTLYKFRSMYNREKKDEQREIEFKKYIEEKIAKGKVVNSNDMTPVGRILRKTSLDELPQFLNVLKGEMTLVGPRPSIPYEVKYYKNWHRDRLLVKPGLSGLWQIYGRGNMPCDSSIFLDLMYVINRSISLDIKIIFKTIPAVVLGKGAY